MNSLKNTLKKIITRNETYVKYRLPFTTDRYLIRWHPKSGTDIHKHNGKNCDFMMIWGTLHEVRFDSDNINSPYKYFDDIYVDGIPIKKWVSVVIRVTGQNIVDVYVNGTLTKRHKLSNIVKQNYDNIYINLNGGFGGNLSNLRYYNYAIGTFEIYRITSEGPDLTIAENTSLQKSKPFYLSSQWYFDNTDPLRN